jgi:hypothetical protein
MWGLKNHTKKKKKKINPRKKETLTAMRQGSSMSWCTVALVAVLGCAAVAGELFTACLLLSGPHAGIREGGEGTRVGCIAGLSLGSLASAIRRNMGPRRRWSKQPPPASACCHEERRVGGAGWDGGCLRMHARRFLHGLGVAGR